jgi:hypothetical protein
MKKFKKLRIFNLIAGVFHAIQGVLILILSNDFSLPVTTNYLKFNEMTERLIPTLEEVTDIRFAPFVALFSFFSAAAHLLIASPILNKWYEKNLKKGANYARWWEYAFSSSLMIALIAMLAGVYDLSTLILLFVLNAMMIFWGLMMELHNQSTKNTDWTAYLFGCVAGIVPWVVIGLYLFGAGDADNSPPDFVYWIFFSIFLFFNSFAANMVLQYKKIGPWKDYAFGEKVYIILSFVAKTALAWQVFGGTLRPE